jgi:uncharacterized protein YndB with AHSA1/START domain
MTMQGSGAAESAGRVFTTEREFAAPREVVFRAFSSAEHLKQWWGPKGWTLPVCEVDFRPGGVWFYGMRGPNGEESWGKATYREIAPPERIVYTDAFADAEGNINPDMPQMEITITFTDLGGSTRVTSRAIFPSAESLDTAVGTGMVEGMNETFDRLEAFLTGAEDPQRG